jgi:hypothetical protein
MLYKKQTDSLSTNPVYTKPHSNPKTHQIHLFI